MGNAGRREKVRVAARKASPETGQPAAVFRGISGPYTHK